MSYTIYEIGYYDDGNEFIMVDVGINPEELLNYWEGKENDFYTMEKLWDE